MLVIWFGAALFVCGLLFMAAQPVWRGRLSGRRPRSAVVADGTLEPPRPGAGFGLGTNWPGLALIALGAVLMLAGAILRHSG
jgi:hypothetical protein